MGYLEFRAGHLDEAHKWYEKAVKLDSQSYLAHYYFAAIAMRRGHLESENDAQIETSLRIAIKLNPSFAPAYDQLGAFLGMRHRNLQEAYVLALNAIQLEPDNIGYRLNAANILIASERGQDAIRVMQNALKVAKSPEEIARVQNALETAEQYQAAREAYEQRAERPAPAEVESAPEGAGENEENVAPATPAANRPADSPPRGTRHTLVGTVRDVHCSAPAKIEFKLDAPGGPVALHASNYYKIQFSALGFTPEGELHPCTEIEGRHARVEFLDTSGDTGQVVSVELRK